MGLAPRPYTPTHLVCTVFGPLLTALQLHQHGTYDFCNQYVNSTLKNIHTLLLDFLFSDWLVIKYAECIENVKCIPGTAPRMHIVLLVPSRASERHID